MIRRFAVLGDIHAEDARLAAVLERVKGEGFDAILSVGDVVDGPGSADRTVELLVEHKVITVRGNHDRWIHDERLLSADERRTMGWSVKDDMKPASLEWLLSCPVVETLQTVRGAMLLCHGIGEDDMTKVFADTEDPLEAHEEMRAVVESGQWKVVVCGHTHERWVTRFGDVWWLNAGTLSPRGAPGYMTVDLDEPAVRYYDVDAAGIITAASVIPLTA